MSISVPLPLRLSALELSTASLRVPDLYNINLRGWTHKVYA